MSPTVAQLEQQLKDVKELIARRDEVLKLGENRLFKRIILDEFCDKESARFAHASADPALNDREQKDSMAMAQAGGLLRRWLSMQIQMANTAERQIHDIEQTLEEVRAEEAEAEATGVILDNVDGE